ncbi:MAG: hypothetical protein ABIP94_19780, partial [Planctomycetota bacterium]
HAKFAWPIGERLVARAMAKKDAEMLNSLAWTIVDPSVEIADRNLELARKAASKAVELTGEKEPNVLDTMARVHAWQGDFAKAVALQKKAVALLGDVDDEVKAGFGKALEEYETKAKAGGK